jgi:hypothetical protein
MSFLFLLPFNSHCRFHFALPFNLLSFLFLCRLRFAGRVHYRLLSFTVHLAYLFPKETDHF